MQLDWQRLAGEVERLHLRYQTEVVEAFGFCPWAKDARSGGRIHMQASFMTAQDGDSAHAALALIDDAFSDPNIEISMLMFPLLPLTRLQFAHFAAAIRSADDARTERGQQRFALAEFHPSPDSDGSNPQELISFLRRTPDPMIQSVRTEVLARVRGPEDHGTRYFDPERLAGFALGANIDPKQDQQLPLAARLAQHNIRVVERVGVRHIEAIFRAIQRDRSSSYAALGVVAPTHAYMKDTSGHMFGNELENEEPQSG
jgi:hypothetical protein